MAIDPTCTALFGEVSWDCQVHLLVWTLTPSVGMTLAAVLPAILGAAWACSSSIATDDRQITEPPHVEGWDGTTANHDEDGG